MPVSESALRAIGPRSMVIDVYIWLAYRLHALRKDVEVGWPSLHAQFGAEVGRIRGFRKYFIECLALADGRLSGRQGRGRRTRRDPPPFAPGDSQGFLEQTGSKTAERDPTSSPPLLSGHEQSS